MDLIVGDPVASALEQRYGGGALVDLAPVVDVVVAKTREALAQYIVRPPVSLQNLLVDEGGTDTVIYRAPYSDYFRTDTKVFPAVEFLVELLQHLPDPRRRPIHTYGLYSSRARGTWARLIKKIYDADPLCCPRCHKPMKVIAAINDPVQILKVLRHLIKTGKPPPGLDPASLD